jgi:hypothetical protein
MRLSTSPTVTLAWNTKDFAYGNYTISAIADTVAGETDTADNTYVDGTVLVTISGDVTGDRTVDGPDLDALANAYGSTSISPNWNPNCDLNEDNKVEALDIFDLSKNYGKTV